MINKRKAVDMNMAKAKTVGILFDAADLENRKFVLKYAEQLKKEGKKVHLLAYIPDVDQDANFDFDFFTNKDIDWAGRVKEEASKNFLATQYDMFICLKTQTDPQFEYISLQTKAAMRIGPMTYTPLVYDFMIDCSTDTKLSVFIKQYERILELSPA